LALALLSALLVSSLAGEGALIEKAERAPAVMMVMTPRGPASQARTSEVLEEAAQVFKRHTGLALASVEQAGVDTSRLRECSRETQFGCWTGHVLDAYRSDRSSSERQNRPAFLVVVSVLADAKRGDRLTTMLIDLERTREIEAELSQDTPNRTLRRENLLFDTAVQTVSGFTRLSDKNALHNYMVDLITRGFRARLERSG
jgi:hypothetical protein